MKLFKYYKLLILIGVILFGISCVYLYHKNYREKVFSEVLKKVPLETNIRDISFFPINGFRFRLSDLKEKKAIVLIMRERDCPISEKYGSRLARMEAKYSKMGIQFIHNYVGQLDSVNKGKRDLERFKFKAPYIIDIKQTVVNTLSVQTTGEVLILTPERELIYRGPLDDQYHLLKSALKAKNNYVSDMLDAIVSGEKFVPKEIPAPGCVISQFVETKELFYKDVASIISKKCSVCHNPSGPSLISYVTYEDVVKRKDMFKYVVENDLMPPWGVDPITGPWKGDRSLKPKEKVMLLKWIEDGCPKTIKNSKLLWTRTEKTEVGDGYTIHLPEKVRIPAEGLNEYKYFIIPTHFIEDKWIKDVEFFVKPKIIHHMWLFIMDGSFPHRKSISRISRDHIIQGFGTLGDPKKEKILGELIDWESGGRNVGYRLPKNSKVVLEIHYEAIGRKIIDDYTHIKINFYKKKPKYKAITYVLLAKNINIPPKESNYQIKTSYKVKKTRLLLGVSTHMHLRGKASSIYVTHPGGIKKKYFGIDPYLFNFQSYYRLREPLKIVKGSILECINWFDNSIFNPINPDPEKYVVRGELLKDEMSDCFVRFLMSSDSNEKSKVISL